MSDDALTTIEQQDPAVLASHYTWRKQLLEVFSVIVFTALTVVMVARLAPIDLRPHVGLLAIAFVASMIVADLISGLVHWLADTWATVEFPILGPTLIKNFREHHADPKALTRKGLIETNGDNCMILFPAQVGALFIPLGDARPEWIFLYAFILGFNFWIVLTNQIHKWAHMETEELSAPIRFLQRIHLILPRTEHKIHHTVPFESHYCITTGWLNGPLARIGFFRWLERMVWRVMGEIPRENDIGTAAAVALSIRQGVLPPGFVPTRDVAGTRNTPTAEAAPRG